MCGADESLRREVESLIAEDDGAASFLETPVGGVSAEASFAGRRLGAYRLDARIGAGGMGEVYRARDTRLGRDVAVKILPPSWTADAQRRTRFEREARAIAALNHPNICTIHDIGHDSGVDFLVMELVDGEPLAARLAKGPLPLDEALARAIEIAGALDEAHRQGIVHRDLKPGNVMLARTESTKPHAAHAKLLDFGLARIAAPAAAAGQAAADGAPLTEAGALLGTLQYMAPEQVEGRPADARTDIFAFGALFYEMLTARRAFQGASTAAVIAAVLREEPPPVPPPDVNRIVRRCVAKDPLRRYQAARDLLNDLEEVRQGLEAERVPQSTARPPRSVGRRAWLAAALLLALLTTGYVRWGRAPVPAAARVERFQLQPPAGVEILPSGAASVLAMSPDGQWVAFYGVSRPQNERALYLRSRSAIDAKKLPTTGIVPFFSPDSRWLGFFAENGIFRMPVDGGRSVQICRLPNIASIRGASWGDDDTIVFSMDRALWRVSANGGEPAQLTRPSPDSRHYWPHVLPGSGAALLTVNRGVSDRWRHAAVVSLKTGEVRTLPDLSGTAPRYVSSGHLVYSRFGALYAAGFDRARLAITTKPVKVLGDTNSFGGSGSAAFDVSASGALVYITGPASERIPEGDLVAVDRGGRVVPVAAETKRYLGAAVDADGRRLVVSIGDAPGEGDLSVYDIDRGTWTRVTTGMQTGATLAWSPDAAWIFFTSFKTGEGKLFRMPARGGEPEQLTFDLDSWDYPTSVSPDGTMVVYWKALAGFGRLMTLRLEPRGKPEPVAGADASFLEASPMLSPDGRWVAYDSDRSGTREVHVRPLTGPGEVVRISPAGGREPRWGRDGRELIYRRGREIWGAFVDPGTTFSFRPPRLLVTTDFLGYLDSHIVAGVGTDRFIAIRRRQPATEHRMLVYVPNWTEELRVAARAQP